MSEVELDVGTIYSYKTHRNIPWTIIQYEPLREYLDPRKALDDRKAKQAGSEIKRYATKRGSFLDQHIKVVKDVPASCIDLLIKAHMIF